MPISTGTCLGVYEVLAPLGAGGMGEVGEVYRARDRKLGREVALKVLPAAFAGDTEHMARFQREAQVLASLNHPNIASIHGLEKGDGVRALTSIIRSRGSRNRSCARRLTSLTRDSLPISRWLAYQSNESGTSEVYVRPFPGPGGSGRSQQVAA